MRYAPPELLTDELSRHCDQYSLAMIYAEMLTGVHPFRGLGPRAYMPKKMTPDLDRLSELDREVIRKALDPDPECRWANCTEMVLALEGTSPELSKEMLERSDSFAKFIESGRDGKNKASYTGQEPANVHEVIADLINAIGGHAEPLATSAPAVSQTGDVVQFQFVAGIPLGAAQEQLQAFSKQMFTRIERRGDASSVMYFDLPSNFWQQWRGQLPRLELHVELARVNLMSATPIEVKAALHARNCSKERAAELFEKMSAEIFNTLQQLMLVNSEKRAKDRLTWAHPVRVIPIDAEGQPEEAIECRGKDLSQSGMGFYLPHDLVTSEVLIELPNPQSAQPVKVHATLVRAKRCADGWYDVGALFRLPSQLRTPASAEVVIGE
jgi:serine/threonine protein kinase